MPKRYFIRIITIVVLSVITYFIFSPGLEDESLINCTQGTRAVTFCDIEPNSLWGRFGAALTSTILYVAPMVVSWATFRKMKENVKSLEVVWVLLLPLGITIGYIITGIGREGGQSMNNYLFGIVAPMILSTLFGIALSKFPHQYK